MPNFKTITARITPDQYRALREEATRRAATEGGLADASRILREMINRWMEEKKKSKK
jgi:hypothetical protein